MSPHPLESLRYVARSSQLGEPFPAQEVAAVLADLAVENPSTLVQACRRMIESFTSSGQAWWLSARALAAADPAEGIWEAAGELAHDRAASLMAEALPPSAVIALGRPAGALPAALRRRTDLVVVKVRASQARRPEIVVLNALAAGPAELLVSAQSAALAGSARERGGQVWVVVGRGTVLPQPLWEHLLSRRAGAARPTSGTERVPAGTGPVTAGLGTAVLPARAVDACVSSSGKAAPAVSLAEPGCAPVAELLWW